MLLGVLAGGDAKAQTPTPTGCQYYSNQSDCESNSSVTTPKSPDWWYCQAHESPSPDGGPCQWASNYGFGDCYPGCVPPTLSKSRSTLRHGL